MVNNSKVLYSAGVFFIYLQLLTLQMHVEDGKVHFVIKNKMEDRQKNALCCREWWPPSYLPLKRFFFRFFFLSSVSVNLLWSGLTEENEGLDGSKVHSMPTCLAEQQQKRFKVVQFLFESEFLNRWHV